MPVQARGRGAAIRAPEVFHQGPREDPAPTLAGGELLRSLAQGLNEGGDVAADLLHPGCLGMEMADGEVRLTGMTRHPGGALSRRGRLVIASVC